jgi:hypothetical protein
MPIKCKRPEIAVFIDNFKKPFDKKFAEHMFTNGNCFHFAVILKHLYPEGEIAYSLSLGGHFVFLFQGRYWDITGEVFPEKVPQLFDEIMSVDETYYARLMRDCAYKYDCDKDIAKSLLVTE